MALLDIVEEFGWEVTSWLINMFYSLSIVVALGDILVLLVPITE